MKTMLKSQDTSPRWHYLVGFFLLVVALSFFFRESPPVANYLGVDFSTIDVQGVTNRIVVVSVDSVDFGSSPSRVLMEKVADISKTNPSFRVSSGVGRLLDENSHVIGYFLLLQKK
ncbi:MAG: hypothetical protein AAB787_01835 [Patescibacteria group bacterium]